MKDYDKILSIFTTPIRGTLLTDLLAKIVPQMIQRIPEQNKTLEK
jgi:hypothetical protein